MTARLQKLIAASGVASRRAAEEMIRQGRVTVNGITAELGATADPEKDEILLDGKPVSEAQQYTYIMLHKPAGYVTTLHDEKGRKSVAELVDCGVRVYPVGRLDMYSEGLLLMTNDGQLANTLLHPSGNAEKVYEVRVSGWQPEALEALQQPMVLDGYRIRPAKVRLLSSEARNAYLEITIHEGRNRQIRKMAQQCGLRVLKLKRVSEAGVHLGALKPGHWRYLTAEELSTLRKHN